jgi:hypothetical protein
MDPQANQQPALNRDQPQNAPTQEQGQEQGFIPYAAFPATMKRDFDPNIYTMIAELVDRKYGAELNPEAREFEISRVYNRLEIEIFEMSTFQLSPEKQKELQQMTEQAQGAPNQQETVVKIREYMQNNVPNISNMVNEYMIGFRNQYMAGRY